MITYFIGEIARDVSRLTGFPWCWSIVESHGPRLPVLDIAEFDYWDRMMVAWAVIGAHSYVDIMNEEQLKVIAA